MGYDVIAVSAEIPAFTRAFENPGIVILIPRKLEIKKNFLKRPTRIGIGSHLRVEN